MEVAGSTQAAAAMPVLQASIVEALGGLQTEMVIFLVALCAHAVIFGTHRVKNLSGQKRSPSPLRAATLPGAEAAAVAPLPVARKPSPGRGTPLARAAAEMLRRGGATAEPQALAAEFDRLLAAANSKQAVADALESVVDTYCKEPLVLASAREVLSLRGLRLRDHAALAEALLRAYFGLRRNRDFVEVLAQVEEAGEAVPASIELIALRASLRNNDFEASLERFRRLNGLWKAEDGSPSAAPQRLMQHLARLAAQKGRLEELLEELEPATISADTLASMLDECRGQPELLRKVESFGRAQGIAFNAAVYRALVKAATSATEAQSILAAAKKEKGQVMMKDVHVAVLDYATSLLPVDPAGSASLLEVVLQQFRESPAPALAAALVRCKAEHMEAARQAGSVTAKDADMALVDLYEKRFRGMDLSSDIRASTLLVEAALRRSRTDLISLCMAACDGSHQVSLVKSMAAGKRLADALAIFHACPAQRSANLHNALLDVCIECKNLEAAASVMSEATKAGVADVVTYNTMVKAHLQSGGLAGARKVVEAMRGAGLQPNCVTYNELLDAAFKVSVEDGWAMLEEMKASSIRPNHISCSILLKAIQQGARARDVERTLAIVNDMEDEVDEVLLSSMVEACIRAGRGDLLMPQLVRHRVQRRVQVRGAHTYGSIIRAYGYVQDLDGVWDTWREMRNRHIQPTSITLGCMVEALVTNGGAETGYELIHEVSQDEQCKHVLNAVIYCSVLKGFSHMKRFDRVWAIYQEMLGLKLDFSIVTYNTLMDACARAGEMGYIPTLLQDMTKQKIEPNLITYSAILKGYCQVNRLDQAFELLESMRQTTDFKPDEIMFNSLLDGCARLGLYDRGAVLLEEMQNAGVRPSNFTLSVLVKLASRGKSLARAFELCEELSTKYKFRLNVHVYSNLINACVTHRDLPRGLSVLERMIRERVRPDQRAYALLIRGYAAVYDSEMVAGLVCAGAGLERGGGLTVPHALTGFPSSSLQPQGGLPADLISEALESISGRAEELAMKLLRAVKQRQPSFRLDAKFRLKLTNRAIRSS